MIYASIINDDKSIGAWTTFKGVAEQNGFNIILMNEEVEEDYRGRLYLVGYSPEKTSETVALEKIKDLEKSITPRNYRAALTGDEFALQKIKDVENQIADLRKQLAVRNEKTTNNPLDDY